MKAELHPGAERDIEEAAAFYEREGSAALDARFLAEVRILVVKHDRRTPKLR